MQKPSSSINESEKVDLSTLLDDTRSQSVLLEQDCERIHKALAAAPGSGQRTLAEEGLRLIATLLRKNSDYGEAVWQCPILAPDLDPDTAILVRMSDKIERLQNLYQKKAEVTSESLDDTLRDLAGYAILYLASPENKVK